MTRPSIKTLMTIPNVTREDAIKIRAIMLARPTEPTIKTSVHDRASVLVNGEWLRPATRLEAIDKILETFGVEYQRPGRGQRSPAFYYCNTGDSYASTILKVNGRYRVGCWGDIVERGNYE